MRGKNSVREETRECIVTALVRLTAAGRALEAAASSVPEGLAGALSPCRSLTPNAATGLFSTLDDIIETLSR